MAIMAKRASLVPLSNSFDASLDVLIAREAALQSSAAAATSPPGSSSPKFGPLEEAEVLVIQCLFLSLSL